MYLNHKAQRNYVQTQSEQTFFFLYGVRTISINNLDLKSVQHLWCFQMEA